MKVLVITGGIGSGKSAVCRILSENGLCRQYNADSRVKALYTESPGLLSSIEEMLGCGLRDENEDFIPSRLAERIFSDPGALAAVEALVFPALIDDFRTFAQSCRDSEEIVVFESATILEKPCFDGFGDKVVLVDAPMELRLERACSRDGADPEAVKARMANQKLMNALSGGASDPRIDAVIVNDSTFEVLEERTYLIMSDLFGDWRRNKV